MNGTSFSKIVLMCFIILLNGCKGTYLSVHTDYLSHENLASFHVQTPDPRLNNPPIGQRLIITWSIPNEYLDFEDIYLEITLRFRNRKQIVENLNLLKRRGTFVYQVLNDDYIATRGILTYKVDLIGNGTMLEEWRHQIWTDLIILENNEPPPPTNETPLEESAQIYPEDFQ